MVMMENLYQKYLGNARAQLFYPRKELRRFIKRYFFYEIKGAILSNKCNVVSNGDVELFIHFGGSHIAVIKDGKIADLRCFLKGICPLGVQWTGIPQAGQNGVYKVVAIAFTLSGLELFRDITRCNFLNQIYDADEFVGFYLKSIRERCQDLDFQTIANMLDKGFMKFFSRAEKYQIIPFDRLYTKCNSISGSLNVERLSCEFNMSYRSINRYFHNYLGISPKCYLRIVRFDKICRGLQNACHSDLMDVIYLCGYYDQSHFIREFREVMHMSPLNFLKRSNGKFHINQAFLIE